MAITLDTLALPDDVLWSDELEWSAGEAAAKRTLQGRLVVQAAAAPENSGRPITLGNEHAWISRLDLKLLQQWIDAPGKQMTLTLHDGRSFEVLFRHWDAPVLEATPVVSYADPEDSDQYRLTALKMAAL